MKKRQTMAWTIALAALTTAMTALAALFTITP
jgi:hypothetical protein